MKKQTLFLLGLLLSTFSWAQKQILPDFHADPSIHFWEGKYWLYPSTDEKGSKTWNEMKRWSTYSSSDLVNWKDEGQIFSLDDISWASEAAFAPDAMEWKGKYYFFFPAGFQIGVAVSDRPNGPFKDALGKPLIKANAIDGVLTFDPCIFIDDDNTPYLYYGGGFGAAVVKLKEDVITLDGEIQKLPLKNYGEGIWVHKKDDTYYFSYPIHIERDGKTKQLLAYSTSDSPTGPFEYRGIILDNDSRNSHHSITEIDGQSYLFYHVQGPSPYERRVCVDYLNYYEDGSIQEVKMTKEGIQPLPIKQ
ncbi:family 43 glycosylhydrolase [Flammeovirga yaeyamensis]|uniref:Family 43 glycosylhydrolase n=1 Tax=Flammeovirga yaeyamensis TaxID=367791 RepID=A0AAX1N6U3_9BACT|nr:family 43 glycosylhydrolase [Flammeovirga yaeyamensis]MBB3697806.1 beta-xylosidase [Flammeovirga yaeyamensis]NMF35838.1 family 43 glycosylhydrolase [Flammeovirga yaeyamensis]QWG03210.1 family 43 glycosylhydrolase [Flammeovirga yaeyamensis]